MIAYEINNDIIKTNTLKSGSRTLLFLNRALEDIQDDDPCKVISREAYEATLMKYHSFWVKKAAKLVMRFLPTKKGLFSKVCPKGNEAALKKVREDFPKAVCAMSNVYEATKSSTRTIIFWRFLEPA